MLTVNTNTTSLITQLNLSKSNNLVKTSIERMSTGFKINRASDDAANMSISKNMECQISGTNVALDNAQQAVNLLQTADGALDNMQQNLLRIRDLTVQAMNGTYSSEEKAMIQGEIDNLLAETYKQRNSTMFNQIRIFGDVEEPGAVALASTVPLSGGSASVSTVNLTNANTQVSGTHPVTPLTEEEAIAQGYTCIHNEEEFANMVIHGTDNYIEGKYCLMGDINFSQVSDWGNVYLYSDGELNGNGYSINNLTINSDMHVNTDMNGLFEYNYGTIKNLNLNNVNIDSSYSAMGDYYYVGSLVSNNYGGTIDNCSLFGSVNVGASTMGGGVIVGGLVGSNDGTITNCSSSATISTAGTDASTGGLVGHNDSGTITDCSSSGTVTGTDSAGGLVGNNGGGTITSCSSSATVMGEYDTGGLVGYNDSGTITDCSSSATVTGEYNTGGLVGYNYEGTIDKSYSTGDVSGNEYVGGLIGYNDYVSEITNSYSLGNVNGNSQVGGLIGQNDGANISTSYSTGTVTGTDDDIGGFVGLNGGMNPGNISNSYTTSELDFYGINYQGEISNCHGRTSQTGVTAHDADWFYRDNLSFLGSAYDTRYDPPDLIDNSRGGPLPPDPPGPTPPGPGETNIQFQIGANSGVDNTITIDTGFSLNGLTADVSTLTAGEKTLNDIDAALERMSSFRSTIGAMQNRLESISQSLATRKNNMEASHSTIMDTDFALETSKLVQNQILQNVAASLLAQANTNPNIALTLLQ